MLSVGIAGMRTVLYSTRRMASFGIKKERELIEPPRLRGAGKWIGYCYSGL